MYLYIPLKSCLFLYSNTNTYSITLKILYGDVHLFKHVYLYSSAYLRVLSVVYIVISPSFADETGWCV